MENKEKVKEDKHLEDLLKKINELPKEEKEELLKKVNYKKVHRSKLEL